MALLPLAVALLALSAEALQGVPKVRALGETHNCSLSDNGQASQDCGQHIDAIFEALRPSAERTRKRVQKKESARLDLNKTVFKYFPNYIGVSVNCNNQGTAFESFSPAAADECGGKTNPFIVAGTGIWSMAGRCVVSCGRPLEATAGQMVAFVLAHEFAHLILGHPQTARQDVAGFCNQWFPAWIKPLKNPEPDDPATDVVEVLTPVFESIKGKDPRAQKAAVIKASLAHCVNKWNSWNNEKDVPETLRELWYEKKKAASDREDAADAFAEQEIIRDYNKENDDPKLSHFNDPRNPIPSIVVGAGQCAMADLKAYEDAMFSGLKKRSGTVSDHPDSDERAERLAMIERDLCPEGGQAAQAGSICDPPVAKPQPSPAGACMLASCAP